jgi:hypothetical protein
MSIGYDIPWLESKVGLEYYLEMVQEVNMIVASREGSGTESGVL